MKTRRKGIRTLIKEINMSEVSANVLKAVRPELDRNAQIRRDSLRESGNHWVG